MRRKRLIVGLAIINVILATAIFMSPLRAQILPQSLLRDCCKNEGPAVICCANCCFWVHDCNTNADCKL